MSARKKAQYLFMALALADLVAILLRAAIVDLYLRPLCLLSLLGYGYVISERKNAGAMLILVGLVAAIAVEVVQKLHQPLWMVTAGTAAYYGCYTLGFILNRSARFNLRTLIPFGIIGGYGLLMFFLLEPYGIVREWSILFILVVTVMCGFSLNPWLAGNRTRTAGFLAVAGPTLLISDSIRIFVIIKMADMANSYLVVAVLEALILLLYFGGQFAVVRSLAPAEASGGSSAPA